MFSRFLKREDVDPWVIFSAMFSVLMIEHGSYWYDRIDNERALRLNYVALSTLLFTRSIFLTAVIMIVYYTFSFILSYFIFKKPKREEEVLSGPDSKPP